MNLTQSGNPKRSQIHSMVLIFAAVTVTTTVAPAAVFNWDAKWPSVRYGSYANGFTEIPVCIVAGSSAEQLAPWYYLPSLDVVVGRVRAALRSSWERSSIRFTGWGSCEALSWSQRAETVGLYIHWDAPNEAWVGGKGKTTKDSPTVQFKPWGNNRQCISWNWGKATYEVRFSCVEQYAIHEFGHIVGFEHEWRHPQRPASCTDRKPSEYVLSQYQLSDTQSYGTFFIPNRNDYDWKSVMTYDTGCAQVEGERFGSPNLSPTDLNALLTVYSPNTLNTLWDLSWYLWTQPDVAAAYGANAAEHFLRFGIREGRMASSALDLGDYLNRYPDLRQAFGNDTALALNHWVQNGIREGRQGSVFFNAAYYLSIYPDLVAAYGANNYAAAHSHWVTWGINEGRRGSAEFDAGYYLRANPDVAAAYGSSNYKGAMLHWLRHGRWEGRRGAQ